MPALRNPRHEKFVREYLRLGVGRHAYKAAGYRARLADPGGSNSADVNASRLLRHAEVEKRIGELSRMAAKRADVTEDSLIEELEQARSMALANAQSGAAVQATMGKARITGHIIDRKEVGEPGQFERMSEQELRAYIAEHMQQPSLQTNADMECKGEIVGPHALHALATSKTDIADTDALPEPTHDGSATKQ